MKVFCCPCTNSVVSDNWLVVSEKSAAVQVEVFVWKCLALSNKFRNEDKLPSVKSSSQLATGDCGETKLFYTNVL